MEETRSQSGVSPARAASTPTDGSRAAYVYSDVLSTHVLRSDHPMRPVRLRQTAALLRAYGAFDGPQADLIEPRPATREELQTFHTADYVDAVEALSAGRSSASTGGARFGFSSLGDNPVYEGMYEAALLSTGASVQAAELVADGTVAAAFSPAGGLHHAMAASASGFCIFNDPVVAINALRNRGLRVAYVDIDVHHGDGVQAAFYRDADVLTISMHESGRWLFPGTGHAREMGEGAGAGYSVNVPLFPYTDDDVFLEAFDAVVPPLVRAFAPDVLATQLGVDTHVSDPLAHLGLTTRGYVAAIERFAALGYPWLAFGGGGYDLDVVARCWTLAYGVMRGQAWPDELPAGAAEFLTSPALRDAPAEVDEAVQARARRFTQDQVDELRRSLFPLHGIG